MRILLDECLPKQIRKLIAGHAVVTVAEAGWAGLENGELAKQAERDFDVILTADQRFVTSAGKAAERIAVVVLRAESNKLESLQPLIPELLDVLHRIQPGDTVVLGRPKAFDL